MRAQTAWWSALTAGLILQTTLFPFLFTDLWRPDVTRALVLWVALTGVPRGGIWLVFAAGALLDTASGAPLGFGVLLRLAVYGLTRPFRGALFDDRPLLLLPFALLGVAVDTVGAGLLSRLMFPSPIAAGVLAATGWRQCLVDVLWVPLIFLLLELATGRRLVREMPA